MTKTEKEVIYDSIKDALNLSGIDVKDGDNENQIKVSINGLKSTLTIEY